MKLIYDLMTIYFLSIAILIIAILLLNFAEKLFDKK